MSRGRRRYSIYGFEPSFKDEEGTDLAAVARGRVALTPIHFDLTDHGTMERLGAWEFNGIPNVPPASSPSAPGAAGSGGGAAGSAAT